MFQASHHLGSGFDQSRYQGDEGNVETYGEEAHRLRETDCLVTILQRIEFRKNKGSMVSVCIRKIHVHFSKIKDILATYNFNRFISQRSR